MATTVFQLSDAGVIPRVDWLHVDSGISGGTDGKIAIIQAPAGSEDADGNPTPDPATYPPADFPPGSLFYPTSYPATLNAGADTFGGGGMVFRRTGGAGSEAWTWISGSYRASNSNGNYQRFADGTQECDADVTLTFLDSNRLQSAWTFPAAFVAAPRARHMVDWDTGTKAPLSTQIGMQFVRTPSTTSVTLEISAAAGSSFASGNNVNSYAVARGNWAA